MPMGDRENKDGSSVVSVIVGIGLMVVAVIVGLFLFGRMRPSGNTSVTVNVDGVTPLDNL
jgi:hypothetical protein